MENNQKDIAVNDFNYGYIRSNKIFRRGFSGYPDAEIGVVKNSPEESISYFEKKFTQLEQKVNTLFEEINKADNKGSYLQKLLHIKVTIPSYSGLGDFETLEKRLHEKEKELVESVEKNRVKNTQLKQALLKDLETETNSSDWINASEKIKEIKNKWIRIGPVEKSLDQEFEQKFQLLLELFYDKRQAFYDERKELTRQRVEKYKLFANRAEELLNASDMKSAVMEMKKIVEEWKIIGKVPKSELEPHITKFKASKKAFFKKISDYKKNKKKDILLSNTQKIQLFMKMNEDLVNILDQMPPDGEDLVKKMQEKWKKIGIIPHSQEYKQLEYIFRTNCQKVVDSYFLRKSAIKNNPNYFRLNPVQQTQFQIKLLKEFIQRDVHQIDNFENNFNRIDYSVRDSRDVFDKKIHALKRALLVKQSLLKDLEAKLLYSK